MDGSDTAIFPKAVWVIANARDMLGTEMLGRLREQVDWFVEYAQKIGVSEKDARNRAAHLLLHQAAITACETKRDLLGGEPEYALWSDAADKAFEYGAKVTENETGAEIVKPSGKVSTQE